MRERTAVRYILIGVDGVKPIFAPLILNISPWKLTTSPRRNRRRISTYSRIVFKGRGDSIPASFNAAALPVPGLAMTRPGANSSIVAIDMAEMIGWREYGLIGAGATLIVFVQARSPMDVDSESKKQR